MEVGNIWSPLLLSLLSAAAWQVSMAGSPWGGVGWEEGSLEEGLRVSEGALVKSDQ